MYRITQLDLLKSKKSDWRISAAVSGIVLTFLALSDVSVAVELSASLIVDPQATSTDRVIVTITGNYLCGPLPQPQQFPNSASLSLNLIEAQGRDVASGSLVLMPQCDGARQSFEFNIVASNHPWHGGPARVTGTLQVQECDVQFLNCQQALAQINSQVKIQGGGQLP